MDKTIVLATKNKGKISEFQSMLSPLLMTVKGLDQFPGCPDVIEDGHTFEENARKKAEIISSYLHLPALADDSGLEVDALEGAPGIYSARFAGNMATDEENNRKLIQLVSDVPEGERTARFRCVLALAIPSEETLFFNGTCEGLVVLEPAGSNGFGYDPLFYLPEWGKTMAQLTSAEKNRISHRGKAMKIFLEKIKQLL